MEKKNYLYQYPFNRFFSKDKIAPMIYASSGSSGKPTFWFRGDDQEKIGGKFHEKIFTDIFRIKKDDSTLVVICFAMGLWVAGNYTLACCRNLSRKGFNLSTITPGIEKIDIINSLRILGPHFKNIVIAGYPPFVMDIVNDARKAKIKFSKNTFVITAGDKFTEEWRRSLLDLLGINSKKNIISIYGSADTGALGHETPISIYIREEALKNPALYKQVFEQEVVEPALMQYDPYLTYFEVVNDELLITTKTSIPLIRYNIHDQGAIIPYNEMQDKLKKLGLLNKAKEHGLQFWKMPFFVKKGRTDVAVTFYAINVYPENLQTSLEDRKISKYLTGNYLAYNQNSKNQKNQKLHLKLELAEKTKANPRMLNLIVDTISSKLSELSIEYRKLYSAIGTKAQPQVKLEPYGRLAETGKIAGLLNTKGKKARMVLT